MATDKIPPLTGDMWQPVKRIVRQFLFPYRWWAMSLVLVSVLAGLLAGLQSLVIAPALSLFMPMQAAPATSLWDLKLDNVGPTVISWVCIGDGGERSIVITVAVLYVSVAILLACTKLVGVLLAANIRTNALQDMYNFMHQKILSLPISFFHRSRAGDLTSRFTTDNTSTINMLEQSLIKMPQALVRMSLCLALMIRTDPMLSLMVVVVALVYLLITRRLGLWIKRTTQSSQASIGGLTAVAQETITSIRVLKSFGAEPYDRKRFRDAAQRAQRSLHRFAVARQMDDPIRLVTDAMAMGAMLLLSYQALEGARMTKPGFIMFAYLWLQTMAPVTEITKSVLGLFSVAGSAARLIDIYDEPNPIVNGVEPTPALRNAITIDHVKFGYAANVPVLKDVSLSINKGEMLAIVGPSGGGKSTLVDLILRLYDPKEGRVQWDGQDIRAFSQQSYLSHFGVVSQECLLLNASISENVVFGRPYDAARIEESLRIANAWDFVNDMPKGVDTMVGDRGINVSGGQRQRLAIARAMYGRPQIIVFDEATSALDTESERSVQQAVDNVIRDVTAIVIAHRLSTVRHAHRVAVVKDGRVEAVGRHDELMTTCETYRRLHLMQEEGEIVS